MSKSAIKTAIIAASCWMGWSLPAQAIDEAALLAAAKAEGRGTLYTSGEPGTTAAVVKAFTDKYGIEIDVQRLTSGALAQRFMAENEAGTHNVDAVMSFDKVFLNKAVEQNLLVPIGDLPEVATFPKEGAWKDNLGFNVAPDVYNMSWNTNLHPEEPKGWQDLIDPKWKGQVMLSDPRVIGGPTRGWFWLMRKTYGDDFLRELGKQSTYSPSSVPGIQQLAAGAVTFYSPQTTSTAMTMIRKNAPIKIKVPDVTLQFDSIAVVPAKAPHPNVGKLLINFWISAEGQATFNKDRYSVRTDAAGTIPLPAGVVVYDEVATEDQLPEILGLLGIQ